MNPSVSQSEESLGEYTTAIAPFHKWNFAGIKVDIPRLARTTFQEVLLISALGFVVFSIDAVCTKYVLNPNYSLEIGIPLMLMVLLIGVKYFEREIIQWMCSMIGCEYVESNLPMKILQKMIILTYLVFVHVIAFHADIKKSTVEIKGGSLEPKSRWEWILFQLQMFLIVATKLTGSFSAATFFRLYLDAIFYSWCLVYESMTADKKGKNKSKKREREFPLHDGSENANRLKEQYGMDYGHGHLSSDATLRRKPR